MGLWSGIAIVLIGRIRKGWQELRICEIGIWGKENGGGARSEQLTRLVVEDG